MNATETYYGNATLESWLKEEVFPSFYNVPPAVVAKFEKYREVVENDIKEWKEAKDERGVPISWRRWGCGFRNIPTDDAEFNELVIASIELLTKPQHGLVGIRKCDVGHEYTVQEGLHELGSQIDCPICVVNANSELTKYVLALEEQIDATRNFASVTLNQGLLHE